MAKPTMDQLTEEYYEKICKCLYYIVRDFPDGWNVALDLAQDTWVKALRAYDTMPENSNFGGWLVIIARNTAYDYMRRSKRLKQIETVIDDHALMSHDYFLMDDPAEQYVRREHIVEVYQQMKPTEALATHLFATGYKHGEIPEKIFQQTHKKYKLPGSKMLVGRSRKNFQEIYGMAQ